ncbi:sn-glycerol-1-phosphate dehydrogenase [Paenibacillus sp. IB182496]|uniref:Sn-glycerol-1-phosphate dehydrogenase n=2 Tax=Paenibacillus sabuli TaxID=2772509 RepID=A0A927BVZ8_9BACL|nr:sn-glycerol-1-phosphate dehydrogenase [Paenibacillus sabuli]
MQEQLAKWNEMALRAGTALEPLAIDRIEVAAGALKTAADYIAGATAGESCVLLVADETTWEAAGETLLTHLAARGVRAERRLVPPDHQGDVVADERSLVHAMLGVRREQTRLLVAVGSGTIHDIVRFVAYHMQLPFVSVPTAPSVDGFNSKGAPILVNGEKITIPASAPIALFADLDVLVQAPAALVAAGFGDMLGKYTSLFDWRFSHAIAGEPYDELAARITRDALEACVAGRSRIAARDAEGIAVLMRALIASGVAMLLFGQSHPASGAEHHLSHYWEMDYLRHGRKQLLHGAKVGVASVEISAIYHEIVARAQFMDEPERAAGGPELARIEASWPDIKAWVKDIPEPHRLQELLREVGGPSEPSELGIGQELLARSLRQAHHVRSRYTLLRAFNTLVEPHEPL